MQSRSRPLEKPSGVALWADPRARRQRAAGRLLPLAAAVLLAAGCGDGAGRRLNVLLVTLDTTRADYLGCYGSALNTSPNIDALAAAGVRFDLAITPSAVTPVSHASILTGRNPHHHGLRVMYAEDGCRLPADVPTLSTLLRDRGWATGAFLSSFTVSEFFGFERGFETFDSGLQVPAERSFARRQDGVWDWPLRSNQRRADETTDRALTWLRHTAGPFLLWVHYWDPHDTALLPPAAELQPFLSGATDEASRLRATYAAEIAYLDRQLGRLLRELAASGRSEQTIVVVVADHGEGLGDHGWWFHRILYQEQIRVPLIVHAPGWPRGAAVPELVTTTDIVPTVLELLGVTAPPGLDGRALTPLVRGEDAPPRTAYADAINLYDLNAKLLDERPDDGLLYCAMDREWKLIHRPHLEGRDELYHLPTDPTEQTNRIGQDADQAQRLLGVLRAADPFVTRPFGPGLDPVILERLRSLGYIGGN